MIARSQHTAATNAAWESSVSPCGANFRPKSRFSEQPAYIDFPIADREIEAQLRLYSYSSYTSIVPPRKVGFTIQTENHSSNVCIVGGE
jgi:hypothetical protein